jgi:glycosyltransferase involved in cell wall biosynthesis
MAGNNILIVVSTWNRKTLTGISLSSLRRNISNYSDVLVLDDASTDYDEHWLRRWGWPVIRRSANAGVGEAARQKFAEFLTRKEYQYVCAVDNDLLYCHDFDLRLLLLWQRLVKEYPYPHLMALSGYRSTTQSTILENNYWAETTTINGACIFADRQTIETCLSAMAAKHPAWPHNWDAEISRVFQRKIVPKKSFVQHLGIYGDGVNGESTDVAYNFIGETLW